MWETKLNECGRINLCIRLRAPKLDIGLVQSSPSSAEGQNLLLLSVHLVFSFTTRFIRESKIQSKNELGVTSHREYPLTKSEGKIEVGQAILQQKMSLLKIRLKN